MFFRDGLVSEAGFNELDCCRGHWSVIFFLVPLSANLRDSMASNFAFSVCLSVPPPMKLYVPAFRIFSNLVCEFAMILLA